MTAGATILAAAPANDIGTWIIAGTAVMCGVGILIGILTSVLGMIAGLISLSSAFGWIAALNSQFSQPLVPCLFTATISLALVFLGPGAFSLDSHLFGRREIIIPPGKRPLDP